MAIRYLDNQPVQLYKVVAGTNERQWDQTAYHKRQGNCFFEGPDYCHPLTFDDFLTFQFKATTVGSDLFQPHFESVVSSGTATGTTADHLIDSGADFVADAVAVDMMVFNTTDDTNSAVAVVTSGTDLELDDDIFVSGEDYTISPVTKDGTWVYDSITGIMTKPSTGSGAVAALGILTTGKTYKITIDITDITAGALEIRLGSLIAATLTSVGSHTVYGVCVTNQNFRITNTTAFIGAFDLSSVTVTEVQKEYTLAAYDLDGVYQSSVSVTAGTETNIGNVLVNIQLSEFDLSCGRYVFGLFEGDIVPCPQLIQNGNFTSATGWATDPGVTVVSGPGGHAEFDTATAGNGLTNTLNCEIQNGKSYTLQYTIGALSGTKTGQYHLNVPDILSPRDSSVESGVQTVNFTANGDQSFIGFEADNTCTFTLDNVSLVCNDCELSQNDADGLSECYCVCESHDCTVLIEFNGTSPTFGNYFPTSDNMMIRVRGRVRNPETPDIDYDPFKSTMDVQEGGYANLQRKEEFVCTLAPEWVHNTLAVVLSHQEVYIDNIRYKRLANYQPKWGNSIELCEGLCSVAQVDQSNLRSTY